MNDVIVWLDTETTGLEDDYHDIVEVAWACDDDFTVKTMVLPHDITRAHPRALEVNRYYERALDQALVTPIADTGQLWTDLTDATIVGANPAFDAGFLKRVFRAYAGDSEARTPWNYRLLDIEAYAAGVFYWEPPLRGLRDIANHLTDNYDQCIASPDHTAAGDVRTLMDVHAALNVIAALNHAHP